MLIEPSAPAQHSDSSDSADLVSRPITVETGAVQRDSEAPTPVQAALAAAAAEAAQSGEEFDAEEKLRRLTLPSPPSKETDAAAETSASTEGPRTSSSAEQEQARDLRRDEVDARAAIEQGAGAVTSPIEDSLSAGKVNQAQKDELRRFWLVHGPGFTKWWEGMSSALKRKTLRSIGPHMEERPEKCPLVPEMTLSWLADQPASDVNRAGSVAMGLTLAELQELERHVKHNPQAAARILNARGGDATRYVVIQTARGEMLAQDHRNGPGITVRQVTSLSDEDPRDLIAIGRVGAAAAARICTNWRPSSTVPSTPLQPPGLERNMQKLNAFLNAVSKTETKIDPTELQGFRRISEADGTFEACYEGECRAYGFAIDSKGVVSAEHGSRGFKDHWPPRAMGLLWPMRT